MEPQLDRIVFVTERPLMIAGIRDLLHCAGLAAEVCVLMPDSLAKHLTAEELCLVILDGESQLSWTAVGQARQDSPDSRFVLLSSGITPAMVHAALTASIHGVLSCWLSMDEAARALTQICRGECQFRFGSESARKTPTEMRWLSGERGIVSLVPDELRVSENATAGGQRRNDGKVSRMRAARKTRSRRRLSFANPAMNEAWMARGVLDEKKKAC